MEVDDAQDYVTYVERSSNKDTYFAFPVSSTTQESDWVVSPRDGRCETATEFEVTGKVKNQVTVCSVTALHATDWTKLAIEVQYDQQQGCVLNKLYFAWDVYRLGGSFGARLRAHHQRLESFEWCAAGVWKERRSEIADDEFRAILQYVFDVGLVVNGVRDLESSSVDETKRLGARYEVEEEVRAPGREGEEGSDITAEEPTLIDISEMEAPFNDFKTGGIEGQSQHLPGSGNIPELIDQNEPTDIPPYSGHTADMLELMNGWDCTSSH